MSNILSTEPCLVFFPRTGVGSLIQFTILLRLVRKTWPLAYIQVVVEKPILSFVLLGNDSVNRVVEYPVHAQSIFSARKCAKELGLKLKRPDVVVSTGSYRTALIARFLGAHTVVGYHHKNLMTRLLKKLLFSETVEQDLSLHEVEDYLRLGKLIPDFKEPASLPNAELHLASSDWDKLVLRFAALKKSSYLVVHSGADMIEKRWTLEGFVSVLKKVSLPIVLLGAKEDLAFCCELQKKLGDKILLNLSGELNLLEAFQILNHATALLCNDNFAGHGAAALGVPFVALFGPTSKRRYRPWSEKGVALAAKLDCRPCYGVYTGSVHCDQVEELHCQKALSPSEVLKALSAYIGVELAD